MKYVLSFENSRLIFLEGQTGKNGITLKSSEEIALPPSPPGAEPDFSRAFPALKSFVKERGLDRASVALVLPSHLALYRELLLPQNGGKQIGEIVWNEMLYYHSNIKEYAVDYIDTGRTAPDGRRYYIAYALRDRYLDDSMSAVKQAGMRCGRVDMASNCLAKIVGYALPDGKTTILAQLDQGGMTLYLIEDSCCILARRQGLRYENFASSAENVAVDLAEQIQKLIQFHSSRRKDDTVKRVLIMGEFSDKEELVSLTEQGVEEIRSSKLPCSWFSVNDIKGLEIPQKYMMAAGALIVRK